MPQYGTLLRKSGTVWGNFKSDHPDQRVGFRGLMTSRDFFVVKIVIVFFGLETISIQVFQSV